MVLKLHRGFILTQQGDINPPTNLETLPGPLRGSFFFIVVFLISKVVLGFRNFGYDFRGVRGDVLR